MVSSSTIRPSVEITGCELMQSSRPGARYLRGYEHLELGIVVGDVDLVLLYDFD
jgi:hypothetical protein